MVNGHDKVCVTDLRLAVKKVRVYSGKGSSKLKEEKNEAGCRILTECERLGIDCGFTRSK